MQRLWLTVSLLLSACGPGMEHHHSTTPQQQSQDDMVCDDETANPRATSHLNNCRRKEDVEDDKRELQNVVNYGNVTQRTR